jgi:uncharacterized membrane protein
MWRHWFFSLIAVTVIAAAVPAVAQEVHQELQETVRAEVIEVVDTSERQITGTDATAVTQQLRIELLEGQKTGEVVRMENDLVVLDEGDVIFVNRLIAIDGTEYFIFKDIERRGALLVFAVLLVVVVVIFAGWQGMRALISLALSVAGIVCILVPALLAGYHPALVSLGVASVILSVILFVTHGFRPHVYIAYIGTMAAVAVTCALAWLSTSWMRLSGFSSDASVYLHFSTNGSLDMAGLLLGGIIIGLLGVLDDVAVTQASVVHELRHANLTLGVRELYARAIRVGRDHVGSLVNTLALAYLGTSLPLIMLYSQSGASWFISVNQEVIAAELLRIILGSIGLVLAVPLTTIIAAWYFATRHHVPPPDDAHGHHHHHHH